MNHHSQIVCTPGEAPYEVAADSIGSLVLSAAWTEEGWPLRGGRSDSGQVVNGYTALTWCPLWQGVNIIAGDIGQIPVRLVRDEFEEQRDHASWRLLRLRPNQLQTPSLWKETMMQWALVWGNGVSWVIRQGSRPAELIPLRPDCLWPELIAFDNQQVLLYHYSSPTTGRQYTFFDYEVVHIQGLTGDGVWGYPLHKVARNCIGYGLSLEKHGSRSFANRAMPSGVLKFPGKLTPDARKNLRDEWDHIHRGPDNAGRIAILQEAADFMQTSMTNVDAQWAEAKKLGGYDAAGLLCLPPHKLGMLEDSAVRANLEEQNAYYEQHTLRRWLNKLAEEWKRKLLTDDEWMSDRYAYVWDVGEYLKGDIETMDEIADRRVKATIFSRNDARRYLGYPPVPGGDEYTNPATSSGRDDRPTGPSGGDSGESDGESARRVDAMDAHRELLRDRLVALLEMESHNLKRAAAGAANFVAWLDDFYLGDAGLNSLVDSIMGASIKACASVGIDARGVRAALETYALRRHSACLEACGVHKDRLPSAIERVIGSDLGLVAHGLLTTGLESRSGEPAMRD